MYTLVLNISGRAYELNFKRIISRELEFSQVLKDIKQERKGVGRNWKRKITGR
jgi:hypothetical protein